MRKLHLLMIKKHHPLCMEHVFVSKHQEYKDIPRWQHEVLGHLNPANEVQRSGGKSYSLSILIQHKHQTRVTLIPYQIISTQDSDISLQGWATSEKASPISIFLVCITSSKHWTGLLMAVNFIKFCLVNQRQKEKQ